MQTQFAHLKAKRPDAKPKSEVPPVQQEKPAEQIKKPVEEKKKEIA